MKEAVCSLHEKIQRVNKTMFLSNALPSLACCKYQSFTIIHQFQSKALPLLLHQDVPCQEEVNFWFLLEATHMEGGPAKTDQKRPAKPQSLRLSFAKMNRTTGSRGHSLGRVLKSRIRAGNLFWQESQAFRSSFWESNNSQFGGASWVRNPLLGQQVTF